MGYLTITLNALGIVATAVEEEKVAEEGGEKVEGEEGQEAGGEVAEGAAGGEELNRETTEVSAGGRKGTGGLLGPIKYQGWLGDHCF